MKLTCDPRYNIAHLRFHEKANAVKTIHVSDELNVDLVPRLLTATVQPSWMKI
jgi:hypothetical protein